MADCLRKIPLTIMRIAHLSDIHLRHHLPGLCPHNKRRGRLMHDLLPAALERICAAQPDFLAITGDLLDVPHWAMHSVPGFERDDPAPWREAALADYRVLKKWLDATGIPYQVVAGNHDWPELMWQVFERSIAPLQIGEVQVAAFHDYEHHGNWPRRFYPERDRWQMMLAHADSYPQLHLQHYLLSSDYNQGYPHGYQESEEMVQRMQAAARPILALSGHLHSGTDLIQFDQLKFTAVPAFCEAPFHWRVYTTDSSFDQIEIEDCQLGAPTIRPVVFLDRDGVINTLPSYRQGPEAMALIPGAADAIRSLSQAGYAVVVITNQSAVGMGYVPEAVLYSVNDTMCRLLAVEGAHLDGIYASLTAGSQSILPRYHTGLQAKPSPNMLELAATELQLDLAYAWMVGDSVVDIECGQAIQARTILVQTGNGARSQPVVEDSWPDTPIVPDLAAAAQLILNQREPSP